MSASQELIAAFEALIRNQAVKPVIPVTNPVTASPVIVTKGAEPTGTVVTSVEVKQPEPVEVKQPEPVEVKQPEPVKPVIWTTEKAFEVKLFDLKTNEYLADCSRLGLSDKDYPGLKNIDSITLCKNAYDAALKCNILTYDAYESTLRSHITGGNLIKILAAFKKNEYREHIRIEVRLNKNTIINNNSNTLPAYLLPVIMNTIYTHQLKNEWQTVVKLYHLNTDGVIGWDIDI